MVEINGTLLVQFINFFILVAILAKFAFKPLVGVMEARRKKIEGDLANAQATLDAAEATRKEYEAQLANARKEAQAIVEKAAQLAERNTQAQIKELKEQLVREKEEARNEIAREQAKALEKMREDMVTLSVAIAGKLVAKNMDSQANVDLVKEAIAKLDSKALG
ncbi:MULTISPECIES: F0F1 ATP synthase subunit B [unclassified Veillonella]|uniref:F0F1 ATP synthase subunit B n=1 Tax=unclassified Veillonella TaxID=2630086 RepID=UPI0013897AE9|nr:MULTISPECIES: F0F1 ATP synthase subunit B [unclassified Veillonella]KAF1683364.1 ATP synthase F0 subunit B [Veillonella sp. R32]